MSKKLFKYKIAGKLFGLVPLSRLIIMHHQKELTDKVEVILEDDKDNRTILLGVLIKAVRDKYRNSKKNLTLKEFAYQVGAPLHMLKEHANKAGLNYESPESIVYEDHKIILLEYLKKLSGKKNKDHKKTKKNSFRLSYLVLPSLLLLLFLSLIDIDNIERNLEKDAHSKIEIIEHNFQREDRADHDADGCPNNSDLFPYDPSECYDNDGDGIGDNKDLDDDNDKVADVYDAFPFDASEWIDTDSDGIGNNLDTDDDDNGVPDDIENLQTQFNKLPKEEKKKIQYALLSKGYYKGEIDSFWGKETQNALTQYADKKGIKYPQVLSTKSLLKDLIIPPHIYIEDYPQPLEIVTKHIYHKGRWSARFPFKIETSGEKSYFVKLVDRKNGTDVMTILIKNGEKFDGKAPAGYFGLKYASGDYWYGNELHFGPNTQYEESMTGLHFFNSGNALNGHTLRLYQVLNGNLHTKKIDGSNF